MAINHLNRMTVKNVDALKDGSKPGAGGNATGKGGGKSSTPSAQGITKTKLSKVKLVTSTSKTQSQEVDGEEDEQDQPDDALTNPSGMAIPQRKSMKATKMYFIVAISAYSLISFLFFIIDLGIWLYICFTKMNYFIREPETAPYFNVVPDAYWMILKFLFGAFVHFVLGIFTIAVLVGLQFMEDFIVKYQERIMLWVVVMACVAEFFMFSGSIEYVGSSPVVTNGHYNDTVLPPYLPSAECKSNWTNNNMRRHPENDASKQIRINLSWMIRVSCVKAKIYMPNNDVGCEDYAKKLKRLRDSDCFKADILSSMLYITLSLNCLGVLFCFGLFFLYSRAVVRTSPGRFSFTEESTLSDLEALKEFAERVKNYGTTKTAYKNSGKPQNDSSKGQARKSNFEVSTDETVARQGAGSISSM